MQVVSSFFVVPRDMFSFANAHLTLMNVSPTLQTTMIANDRKRW